MNQIKIDIEKNIGYFKTDNKKSKVYKTITVAEDYLVDINSDNEIIGVELLNPFEQITIKLNNNFLYSKDFVDELSRRLK